MYQNLLLSKAHPFMKNPDFNILEFFETYCFSSSVNPAIIYDLLQWLSLMFSHLKIVSTIHNLFQPFTLACNHISTYQFSIKPIQKSRWDRAPAYSSYSSIFAIHYTLYVNSFGNHFLSLPPKGVTSTFIDIQPRVWKLDISYSPPILSNDH